MLGFNSRPYGKPMVTNPLRPAISGGEGSWERVG